MSHFEEANKAPPPPPPPKKEPPFTHGAVVITSDMVINYGTTFALVIGIMIVTYLMVTRCKKYWIRKLKDWAKSE